MKKVLTILLIAAAVIVLALLADFTFVPALLSILKRVPAR